MDNLVKQWFRLCEVCGAKEYKVVVGNIVDWRHSLNIESPICKGN